MRRKRVRVYETICGRTDVQPNPGDTTSDHAVLLIDSSLGWLALDHHTLSVAVREARALVAVACGSGVDSDGHRSDAAVAADHHLVDAVETARRLSVKPSWLLQRAREGRIPHFKIGKYVRFDFEAVRAALAKPSEENGSIA